MTYSGIGSPDITFGRRVSLNFVSFVFALFAIISNHNIESYYQIESRESLSSISSNSTSSDSAIFTYGKSNENYSRDKNLQMRSISLTVISVIVRVDNCAR